MFVDILTIEITRRCNMVCEHCLRGDAQRLDISRDILLKIFNSDIDRVSQLIVTGGEPSCYTQGLEDILYLLRRNTLQIESFYMVTNRKRLTRRFMETASNIISLTDDPMYSDIVYSNDKYHEGHINSSRIWEEYIKKCEGILRPKYQIEPGLINMGRSVSGSKVMIFKEQIENNFYPSEIYINALGKVLPICDLSYNMQEWPELIMGDINEEGFTFKEAISNFSRMHRDVNRIFVSEGKIEYEFADNFED